MINKENNYNIDMSKVYDTIDENYFHRKKRDYNIFEANPNVEEIPTFTYENDRNLNSYKNYINNKSSLIEQNSKNYLEYMKKFENKRKTTPFCSPYSVFKEKTQIINSYSTDELNNINKSVDNYKNKYSKQNYLGYNIGNYKTVGNDDISQETINNLKSISIPPSLNNFLSSGSKKEITNPNYYYQRMNKDFYKYRAEQKSYLDYNYQMMENKLYQRQKKEPEINPYNPKNNEVFENGKSDLLHNPILNPTNNYCYNKYLEKDFENNRLRRMGYKGSNINEYYNYQNLDNNTLSPLQQAGSQLLNNKI